MEKIKLLGVVKSKKHNIYIFPKIQEVLSIIRKLLKEIGYESEFFGRPEKYGEPLIDKESDIKSYIDRRFSYDTLEDCVDIIFGKNKVFVLIHTSTNKQKIISDIVKKLVKI